MTIKQTALVGGLLTLAVLAAVSLKGDEPQKASAAGPLGVAGTWTFLMSGTAGLFPFSDSCTVTLAQTMTSLTKTSVTCGVSGSGTGSGTIDLTTGSFTKSTVLTGGFGTTSLTLTGTFSKDGTTASGTLTGSISMVGAVSGTFTATKTLPPDPKASFQIAFVSNRDGNNEIYKIDGDGSGQTRLTNDPAYDVEPAWSPDGTKIAFHRETDTEESVFVMNSDGSGVTNLTNAAGGNGHPSWSPDGMKIAFYTSRDGNNEIYSMNADGSGQTNLTQGSASDSAPSWSPDGSKIAFQSNRDGNHEIYVMNANGSGQTRLTNEPAFDTRPQWSPDGTKVAFESYRDGQVEIYVMNADGSNPTNITNTLTDQEFWPTWKAGGEKIAYFSNGIADPEIRVMNADGSGVKTNITNDPGGDSAPDWSRVSGIGADFDQDGCTDAKEAGTNQVAGGRRNPQNFWDFFDTPDASNVRDKAVAGTDFFAVLARFGSSGSPLGDPLSTPPAAPAYHTAFDRGAASGDPWDLTAANGAIAGTDFFAILTQFGHDCS